MTEALLSLKYHEYYEALSVIDQLIANDQSKEYAVHEEFENSVPYYVVKEVEIKEK